MASHRSRSSAGWDAPQAQKAGVLRQACWAETRDLIEADGLRLPDAIHPGQTQAARDYRAPYLKLLLELYIADFFGRYKNTGRFFSI